MQQCNFHYEAMPDEITNFEICGFHKNTEIEISREKKRYFLRIKGYFIA